MSTQAHTPSRSSFPVVIAIIALFLLFWYLTSKVYVSAPEVVEADVVEVETLAEHKGAADDLLNNYKVTDAANGKVRLSIERAKELVVAENAE